MRRLLFVASLSLGACTALIGDRQHPADLSVDHDLSVAGEQDLAGFDVAPADLAGRDLAGVDQAGAPDMIRLDLTQGVGIPNQAMSTLQTIPGSSIADGSSNVIVRVTVKDQFGTPVANEPVVFSVSGMANTLSPTSGLTSMLGVLNATLSSTKAEMKTATASVGGFMLTAPVTFTSGNAAQGSSTLTASPNMVTADNVATTTVTVTVKDVNGNLVDGQAVSLASNGSANTFSPASGTTTNGVFTATLKTTKAETKTVTGTVGAFMLTGMVDFVAGVPNAAQSTIAASPTTNVVANDSATSTVTVTAKDVNGNLVSGAAVVLTPSGAGASLAAASGSTNASGVYATTLKSSQSGAKTVTATAGGVAVTTGSPASVMFLGCPSNGTLTAGAAAISSDTSAGSHLYTPVCSAVDSPEHVYRFSVASQFMLLDRGPPSAGAVMDLRAENASMCSLDSASAICTASRYVYCPSVTASYQLVIDNSTASTTTNYSVTLKTGAAKGTNSYGVVQTTPTFISIAPSAGAAVIANSVLENGTASVLLPFDFKYFGTQHTAGETLTVYQSGYLAFGAVLNTHVNTCLPTATLPTETIAPFWSWLTARTGTSGDTYVYTQGTTPNRTFTIEWNTYDGSVNASSYECIDTSIQMILYEGSNQIEFRYKPIDEDICSGNSADQNWAVGGHSTIGLQGNGGSVELGSASSAPKTCNTATGLGPAVVGTCSPRGTTTPCAADKGFLFVPKTAGCP